jgi:hypothetical protein
MATATITVKKTAGPVDAWFRKAAGSEGVRIRYGKKTHMLFDSKRVPQSYAEREYDVTPKELDAAVEKINAQAEKNRKAGRSRKFNGNIDDLLRG